MVERMRAALRDGNGGIRIGQVPDAAVRRPTDAVVRVLLSAVCGTDLHGYQGGPAIPPGPRAGHEFLGMVTDTGTEVRLLQPGDIVLAPFMWADGRCAACRSALPSSCPEGGMWGGDHDGGQAEAVRVPYADATLVRLPVTEDDERLPALLSLADVMVTGLHAVRNANVTDGRDVAVIGDGAVGLCAVLAARRAGAGRVRLLGHHRSRLRLAERFGAEPVTDPAEVRNVAAVLECTGSPAGVSTALDVVNDGGVLALVGAPQGGIGDLAPIFLRNLTVTGGLTPARALIPMLLDDVLAGRLDPSPIFDCTVALDDIAVAYRAMADRAAIKALIRP
ncbi:alcohol dehydrogenase catalytic domain-containing protein [Spirillospora sp. CA-253888]